MKPELSIVDAPIGNSLGIPKNIWICWFQGFTHAPTLVKKCSQSWELLNPGWTIHFVDLNSASELTNLDFSIGELSKLSFAAQSDILRLKLLAHYGGVWVDATCYAVQPLDQWLPFYLSSGFFAFERPGPDRLIASWFLASERHNQITQKLFDLVVGYFDHQSFRNPKWKIARELLTKTFAMSPSTTKLWFSRPVQHWMRVYPYFALHYLFYMLINNDPECAEIWANTSKLSAEGPHRLFSKETPVPASLEVCKEIDDGVVPLYKLNRRIAERNVPTDSGLGYLLGDGN